MPINARVTVWKVSKHLYGGSHVGGHKNAHQSNFSYDIIENSQTSLACNFSFVGPNNFKFGTKTLCVVLWPVSKLIIIPTIMFLMTS